MKDTYYFIGIAGIGMSALARYLLQKGAQVSGSDSGSSSMKELLRSEGATVYDSHSPANLESFQGIVVFSSAIAKDNCEFLAAKERHLQIIHRSELLASFMEEHSCSVAIAGSHGKTTTSTMVAELLSQGNLSPSYILGGISLHLKNHAMFGGGSYLVAEADESDGSFLHYCPDSAVITNISDDHLDYFGSSSSLDSAFKAFASQVVDAKRLIWNGDEERLIKLGLPGIRVGMGKECDARIINHSQTGWTHSFDLIFEDRLYSQLQLQVAGLHNVYNAAMASIVAIQCGVKEIQLREGLLRFQGVKRRLQRLIDTQELTVIDDYAHHPNEIRASLYATRQAIGQRRLIALFQPHRYSRLRHIAPLLPTSFIHADQLIITDVYSAGEKALDGDLDGPELSRYLSQCCSCQYVSFEKLGEKLDSLLQRGDLLIGLGAGNISAFLTSYVGNHESLPTRL